MDTIARFAVVLGTLFFVACDGEPGKDEAALKASGEKAAAEAASAQVLQDLIAKNAAERKKKSEEAPSAVSVADIECAEGTDADFHDAALEQEVRRKLGKAEGTIKQSELKKVRSVNLAKAGVKVDFLDPCIFPHLTGVKDLFLGQGNLSDISQLKHLRGLTSLRASMNRIDDISVLAGLSHLDRVDLGRTRVSDLKPLAGAKELTELMLDDTLVDDISPLSGLEKLEVLALSRTKVTDIKPLAGLKKLKSLTVSGAPVESPFALARPGLRIIND